MKLYTNKFNDNFYIPVTNNSCRDELGYRLVVNDTYGLLSIENTVGPGPKNDIYITVPKVPSNPIAQGTLYAKKRDSGEYYLEISVPNSIFKVYENGKRFYIFYSSGSYSEIHIDFIGYNGEFPDFLIDEKSLRKLLGTSPLPTASVPVLLNSPYSISTEFETRNFLKVSTSTSVKGQQTASVTLYGLQSSIQATVYDFVIDPVDAPVKSTSQPPIGIKYAETSQLSRSFIPVSSIVTLQVDSAGELYMDKLYSAATTAQTGYRRRCTNLGFEKDLSKFCSSIPKPSLYEFSREDFETSSPSLSDQYFTDVNSGVSINKETPEGFRFFAPMWIKDRVPSYFAIFRRSSTNNSDALLDGASLVTLIDIQKTELGPYLNKLISNENFQKAPLEVSIENDYMIRWNGVSVDTGYWVSHTEFMGIDIQQGMSDFQFNEMLSGGFSRGSIVCPQFMNIEFLFNDNEAKLYDVNQYFGMYCDDVELSKFIPNVDSTTTLFNQNETRVSTNSDFNSSVISNPDGVKLVVDLNETPDRNLIVTDPSTMVVNSTKVSSRYPISIAPTTTVSRSLKASFTSDSDITASFLPGSKVRLEDDNRNFVAYVTVSSSSYSSNDKKMTVTFVENDTYSTLSIPYWINVFDFSPDPSPSIKGRMRFDSLDASKSRCVTVSNTDVLGNPIQQWISSVVDVGEQFRDCLVMFDKSSSAYTILLAEKVEQEQEYTKVFFDVLETNGQFIENDQVFINVSEYDVDGAIPGPDVINSKTRKFILKPKDGAYSVKSFEFSNYKNSVVGLITLDSTTFNLGSIVGTTSNTNVPTSKVESPYTGIGIKFPSTIDDSVSLGDKITVEQTIGQTKRRWSVIRSTAPTPQVSKIPGAVTEVAIVDGSIVTTDSYTQLEIEPGNYFPTRFDSFELINGTTSPNVQAWFISAQEQDNGNILLTFMNPNTGTDYQSVRASIPETATTYFNYGPSDSLETVIAVAFQRFSDCPLRSATGEGTLYLYSPVSQTDLSIGLYFSYSTINQMQINSAVLKPNTVIVDGDALFSDYYIYDLESLKDTALYTIERQFLSKLENGTKILSKSGSPSTVSLWNNGLYGIPDIRSIVEDGSQRVLIKFDGNREPSLLNDRLQLINTNTVGLSLLSFYDLIDLDFFEEIPVRLGTYLSGSVGAAFNSSSSIFSQKTQTISSVNNAAANKNQKTLVLSANIADNIYSDWKNWDPSNNPDFLAFGKPKGSTVPSDTLPTSWNPSYGFKIQYLNKSNQWVDYQINYPTVKLTTPLVQYYSVNPSLNPMWQLSLIDPTTNPSVNPSFYEIQAVLNTMVLYMYTSSFSERLRAFSEIKRLVSYCFSQLSKENISILQDAAMYTFKMVLSIDDEHKDYRYISTFPEGTYTVTEADVVTVVGGKAEIEKKLTGVPQENIEANFAASLMSPDNKTRISSGRWKKRNSTNVDFGPYLINVDPLLLPYDMFVNATEDGISTNTFSLDWYLISGWPKFGSLENASKNYQYIGKRVSIDSLKSPNYDYFTEYLTVGHGEEMFIDGTEREKRFLWTVIEQGDSGYSTTYKGMPFSFTSPKIDLSGSKFAAILQVENDLDVPTKVTLIYNQVWKTLTLFVQINIDSYFIDGSIGLEQLYQLKVNTARTDTSMLYGPMMVYGSNVLSFDKVDRAYNEQETVITNVPLPLDDYYEYNQYQYNNVTTIKYDQTAKDIELFGVKYFPNVDYVITGDIFFGTKYQTNVSLVIPKSRIRGVLDPTTGMERTFIDGLYGDDFFAVLSDIDGAPIATYARFVSANTIRMDGTVIVSNTYYSNPTPVSLDLNTSISNSKVYAIGDWPVYRSLINDISASSVFKKMKALDFDDVLVDLEGLSRTNMTLSYRKPPVIRPSKTKNASVDEFGNITIEEKENNINLFRLDGGFEPSYKQIVSFAASEDPSITKQLLNSFRGYNTQVIGVNPTNIWYRRVSEQGVNTGNINLNGTILKVPYAIGRKLSLPLVNVWSSDFYSKAADSFIDVSVEGLQDPKDYKFFLSSKIMSVPTFIRTSNYSCIDASVPSNHENASVSYISGETRVSVQIDLERVISDQLFNAGVFAFFSSIWNSLETSLSPYDISKEYIERNLLGLYSIQSIDVYQRPSTRTEVVAMEEALEMQGFTFADTIGIEARRFFDFSIPVDGSKQIVLAFNIKRR